MTEFDIGYLPKAIKQFSRLPKGLQDEYKANFKLLQDSGNHHRLKVHKLHGWLKDHYSASIDYSNRIVFRYKEKTIVIVLVGDHSIYD